MFFFQNFEFFKIVSRGNSNLGSFKPGDLRIFFNKIACFQMKFRETNIAMAMIPAQCKGDMFPLANWSNPE